MTKRYLVAAGLLATVCVAHAEVVPAAAAAATSSNFLDQWKDAAGNDITASNVLGSNVRLIGGVALGHDNTAQSLIDKAAPGSDGAVTVKRVDGVTGSFAVVASNYKAAAAAGTGISVTTDSHGAQIIARGRGAGAGGGAAGGFGGSGGGGGGSGGSWGGSDNGAGASGNAAGSVNSAAINLPNAALTNAADPALNGGLAGAAAAVAAPTGDVPEPSSIALLFAGMIGAMSVLRRRAR